MARTLLRKREPPQVVYKWEDRGRIRILRPAKFRSRTCRRRCIRIEGRKVWVLPAYIWIGSIAPTIWPSKTIRDVSSKNLVRLRQARRIYQLYKKSYLIRLTSKIHRYTTRSKGVF